MNTTRSTTARIIRHGQNTGALPVGTSPVGMAAYVRGFLRGRTRRSYEYRQSVIARQDELFAQLVREAQQLVREAQA